MKIRLNTLCLAMTLLFASAAMAQDNEWTAEKLLYAAQQEQMDDVRSAIDAGIDVNSKNRYGSTALFFACDDGNEEMVKYLLEKGADPNITDTFYNATPMTWAQSKQHDEIVMLLVEKGAEGGDGVLLSSIIKKNIDDSKRLIASGKISTKGLRKALAAAKRSESEELIKLFEGLDIPEPKVVKLDAEKLKRYAGKYQGTGFTVTVEADDKTLMLGFNDQGKSELAPVTETEFEMGATAVKFELDGDKVKTLKIKMGPRTMDLTPIDPNAKKVAEGDKDSTEKKEADAKPETKDADAKETKEPTFGPSSAESLAADKANSSKNWASFRGNGARGVAEGQNPPVAWNVPDDENVKWKTAIPGLGLSCPSIFDDRIYITTAVNTEADLDLKIGLYGDVASVEEDFVYDFKVICVEKSTGKILWDKTAISKKPAVKRHAKSSHANPTVATDGKHVLAFFGSEGLYCYDTKGTLLWKKDLGTLDSGWFYDAGYQWGFGASPILFDGHVIVQCDIQKDSFIASYSLKDGKEAWRVPRDEIPSWSSPTIYKHGDMPMLLTHGTNAARGYDARNGELLWTLPKHSEIVVPTPFVAHGMIFVTSGYTPIQPIYAIRPDARGDISLKEGEEESNQYIAWSKQRGGPYMPSPIAYGDYLYTCANNGIVVCYDAKTGKEVYKERLKGKGSGRLSFTASPLAGDGHLYFPSEDGRMIVVKAGPEFEIVGTNPTGENLLATPAISEGVMYLRTQDSLIAVGK